MPDEKDELRVTMKKTKNSTKKSTTTSKTQATKTVPVVEENDRLYRDLTKKLLGLRNKATSDDINRAFGNLIVNNPDLRNRVLKNYKTISYLPDRDMLENALDDPYSNERLLRGIGANLFNTCFPLYKMIRLYDGLLSYKHYVFPQNVDSKYMNKPRYLDEQRFVFQWMRKLNPEYQFRRIVQEVLQSGKRAYVLREVYANGRKDKDALDEGVVPTVDMKDRKVISVRLYDLPDDYIKIVGRSSDSYYTVAFDFSYFFSQSGTSINDFPESFKRYYDEVKTAMHFDNSKGRLIVNSDRVKELTKTFKNENAKYDVENLKNGAIRHRFWINVPSDECQVFSMDETTPLQAPNFLGLFLMAADLQGYNLLQQQLTGIPLYSVIVGEVPINPEKTNPLVLSDATVDYYTAMINSLMPNGTTFVMTPTKDNKVIKFDEQPNATKIYGSALQGMIATAGVAGLTSTTDKPNLSQNKASQVIEKRFVDVLYSQFEDFVNRRLERMTDNGYLRYDWLFQIFGSEFSDDKEIETLIKLLTTGQTYALPRLLAHLRLNINDAVMLANQVKASGLYDLFVPLISTYQQSGDKGRPEKDEGSVDNDNTAKSKEAGTNKIDDKVQFALQQLDFESIKKQIDELKEIILNEEKG